MAKEKKIRHRIGGRIIDPANVTKEDEAFLSKFKPEQLGPLAKLLKSAPAATGKGK